MCSKDSKILSWFLKATSKNVSWVQWLTWWTLKNFELSKQICTLKSIKWKRLKAFFGVSNNCKLVFTEHIIWWKLLSWFRWYTSISFSEGVDWPLLQWNETRTCILNMEAFFARANCVLRKRTLNFDDKVHTSFTNKCKLTIAARKFSPAQPFRNYYPRFRLHRSHKYDEEFCNVVCASFSNNITPTFSLYESRFQLYFVRFPILSQLKTG